MLTTRLLQSALALTLARAAYGCARDWLRDRHRAEPEFDDMPEIRAHHERTTT